MSSSELHVRTKGESPTRDVLPPGEDIGFFPQGRSPYSGGRAKTPEERLNLVVQALPVIGALLASTGSGSLDRMVQLEDATETKTTIFCYLKRAWKGVTVELVWDIFNRWDCPACGQKNFNSHYVCQNDACKQPRPA